MRIAFVGQMGSGKSFMASKLAEEFNLKSFDLDQMIEKKYNLTINDIFAKYGEDFFRKAEREMLEKVCGIDEIFILATGGGTPCFYDNIKLLREHFLVIYLNPKMQVHLEHLGKDEVGTRPLLEKADKVSSFLSQQKEERSPYYDQSHIEMQIHHGEKAYKELKERLKRFI